eukprot:TRINITY_DN67522_c0_g1_i1.p1 TRINITY_DN67522_c0_g1~~TRINITY_DN67522_c0_g1_i1.p1  ORF type:complete len:285 (-),score=39.28 TRINITY_DN67522_c0_g1_i1:7-840(-)
MADNPQPGERSVFIGGIPLTADETEFKNFLSGFGEVRACKIGRGTAYKFAIIEFVERSTASRIKQNPRIDFQGKLLTVNDAKRKAEVANKRGRGGDQKQGDEQEGPPTVALHQPTAVRIALSVNETEVADVFDWSIESFIEGRGTRFSRFALPPPVPEVPASLPTQHSTEVSDAMSQPSVANRIEQTPPSQTEPPRKQMKVEPREGGVPPVSISALSHSSIQPSRPVTTAASARNGCSALPTGIPLQQLMNSWFNCGYWTGYFATKQAQAASGVEEA